jgi:hypothetical protein
MGKALKAYRIIVTQKGRMLRMKRAQLYQAFALAD